MLPVQPLGSPLGSGHLWDQHQGAPRSKSAFQRELLAQQEETADETIVRTGETLPAIRLAGGIEIVSGAHAVPSANGYAPRFGATPPLFLDIVV